MINGKKVLAVIPARGGSKRLPNKNILPIAGKPLIGWTIEAAQSSKYIDSVYVSTDSEQIAGVAAGYNVNPPERRPQHLATDTASSADVLLYMVEKYGEESSIVVLLQPTSPLRSTKQIDEALELYVEKKAFSVVSLTECEHSPLWANTLPDDFSLSNFLRVNNSKRSQDLDVYYRFNGSTYVLDIEYLQKKGRIDYSEKSFGYVMDRKSSVDIDNFDDFELAEFYLNKRK